jgi:hypothetical protein
MSSGKSLYLFTSVCASLSLKALYAVTFVFLILFASSASSETILTVQHNNGYTADAASVAVPFNSNVASGNLILVAVSTFDGESLEAPTDTLGDSFVQLVTKGTTGASVAAIYAATTNASGADTVTCSISAKNNIHCHVYEVEGVKPVVDKTGTSTIVASTALTVSTSGATTNNVDYLFACFADNGTAATYTQSPGWGDIEQSNDGGDSGFSEAEVVITPGIQTATATASNSADNYVNVIVALETSGTPAVPIPAINPLGGTYTWVPTVNITDSTAGSTIYYTTRGTTPTTSSSVYSTSITVSTSETLEALATAPGMSNSVVESAVYTITIGGTAATPTLSLAVDRLHLRGLGRADSGVAHHAHAEHFHAAHWNQRCLRMDTRQHRHAL